MADAPHPTVWPFLVGRGRTAGHQVIVAPAFLIEEDLLGVLLDALDRPEPTGLYQRRVAVDPMPEFSVVFRSIGLAAAEVGESGGMLQDRDSREVRLTEGVVVRPPGTRVDQSTLDRAHDAVLGPFTEFWRTDGRYARPSAGAPLRWSATRAVSPLELPPIRRVLQTVVARPEPGSVDQPRNGDQARPRRGCAGTAVAGLLALIAVIAAFLLR